MQSSNKISLSPIGNSDPLLRTAWGGVFYHPIFVEAGAKYLNLSGQSNYFYINEKLIGAINLLFGIRQLLRTATIPLLFQYYGPLIFADIKPDSEISNAIDSYLSRNFDFAYLSLPPDSIINLEKMNGWKSQKILTISLNRKGLEKWGRDFREDVKNKINKARRENVSIAVMNKLPLKLWELSFSRKGIKPPIKPELLEKWSNDLIKASLLKIYAASIDDNPIAFRGELILGDFAYDWIAGSDPEFHSSGTNQLLMAEIGDDLSKTDIKTWDLVGGQIKSIADFKKSFGAKEIYHYQMKKSFNIKGRLFDLLREIKHARQ